jgi:hypothetical protein
MFVLPRGFEAIGSRADYLPRHVKFDEANWHGKLTKETPKKDVQKMQEEIGKNQIEGEWRRDE